MKKRIILIFMSIVVLASVVFSVIFYLNKREIIKWQSVDSQIQYFNNNLKGDIIVYGEDYYFRKGFNYRRINEISDETLGDFDGDYKILILLDIDGKMEISDEKMLLVKKYCEEKYMDMIYLGTDKLNRFKQLKFSIGFDDDEVGFEYIGSVYYYTEPIENSGSNNYVIHGGYSKEEGTLENTVKLQDEITWEINHFCENYYKALNDD